MAKLNNTFEFVGNLKLMNEPVKETEFNSGWTKRELKAMISESKANGVFLTLEGGFYKSKGEPDKVFSFTKGLFGEKGNKLEVAWEDRNNQSIINSVADFSKKIIDLTTDEEVKNKFAELRKAIWKIESNEDATDADKEKLEGLYQQVKESVPHRYEFLHSLDLVNFFEKYAEKLNGKKFRVKGDVKPSYWNGSFRYDYEVASFELVDDEEPNKLHLDLDLYFSKEVVNKGLFKTKKLLTFDTYILAYDGQTKKEQFFPLQTVLDASNYDLENPKHQGHIDIVEKFFTVKDKNKVYQLPYTAKLISGAETVDFSEKDLTEDQRTLIDIGMATLEDFKPKGQTFGDKVEQIRLVFPKIKNLGDGLDFTKGAKETLVKVSELQYVPKEDGSTSTDTKKDSKVTDTKEVDSNPFDINPDDLPF